jgi:limonene-1,2-epoxide hydrolase
MDVICPTATFTGAIAAIAATANAVVPERVAPVAAPQLVHSGRKLGVLPICSQRLVDLVNFENLNDFERS